MRVIFWKLKFLGLGSYMYNCWFFYWFREFLVYLVYIEVEFICSEFGFVINVFFGFFFRWDFLWMEVCIG